MGKYLRRLYGFLATMAGDPRMFLRVVKTAPTNCSARNFSRRYTRNSQEVEANAPQLGNPLWDYFQQHEKGHGIWKWEHYFDIYHRHFERFIGKKVNVLEVGVYSGGSLEMWRSYFGDNSHIYGVDIEEACKKYESDGVSILIGDQADRAFWKTFKARTGGIDILIDDGGHVPEQQQITLEEMLPSLNAGGVYLCEDIHGTFNEYSTYASSLVNELNHQNIISDSPLQSDVSSFQSAIHSLHFYPYVVVIEKHRQPIKKLSAPRHGTVWQPYL
jgi:hypothetical protein